MGDDRTGIDVGAWGVKVATASGDRAVPHRGDIDAVLLAEAPSDGRVAFTGAGGRAAALAIGAPYVELAVALLSAPDRPPECLHVLDMGAGSSTWLDLDARGGLAGVSGSSLCAAGTGGFLDKQAERLGIGADVRAAPTGVEEPPHIAARCAVFARSDLIHHQQQGRTRLELWSGLCRGMVENAVAALLAGRSPRGPVWFTGGIARDAEVVRWLREALPVPVIPAVAPEAAAARGARTFAAAAERSWEALIHRAQPDLPRWPRLALERSPAPDTHDLPPTRLVDGCEVRRHRHESARGFLGLDIGSTSTKAVLLAPDGEPVIDLYRRTDGDPLGATTALFRVLRAEIPGLELSGVATTGSGRKLVGGVIGADVVVNEISAHLRGVRRTDPDVTTIFEIGGQDAKFVSLGDDGLPSDANMNYLCAAGTGAFVEEQAKKLGMSLDDIGPQVLGVSPPQASDRCTVFMERQVDDLLRRGYGRPEVMGSVLYAVAQNYLQRVVEKRPFRRDHLAFLGATARNPALVAAFEQLLEAPIHVSPWAHLTGALGAAELAREQVRGATRFRGWDTLAEGARIRHDQCDLCTNRCAITHADLGEGREAAWGFLCGREPDAHKASIVEGYRAFGVRERRWARAERPRPTGPVIGLPRALLSWSHLPFWRRFFAELGWRAVVSHAGPTQAQATVGADFCFPLRLADAHAHALADDPRVDAVFLPHLALGERHDDGDTRSVFCPLHTAFPSIAGGPDDGLAHGKPVLTPVVDLQWDAPAAASALHAALAVTIHGSPGDYERAWREAIAASDRFERDCLAEGEKLLAEARAAGRPIVIVLGRSYLVHDAAANLDLPQKLAALDVTVVPLDMVPVEEIPVDPRFPNVYWKHGRRMLQAASWVAAHPGTGALLLTAHGCGPDAFLRTFLEKILVDRPFLQIELDGHGADAGYQTRLEVFRDILRAHERPPERAAAPRPTPAHEPAPRRLWIPAMHPYATTLAAAAFRGVGIPARAMPPETAEVVAEGRRACRGTECLPAHAMLGSFLQILAGSEHPEQEALFLPSARGPCRFGQYPAMYRLALDGAGYPDAAIESWDPGIGAFPRTPRSSRPFFDAIVVGDVLYALRNRWRPYAEPEAFDRWVARSVASIAAALEAGQGASGALATALSGLDALRTPAGGPLRQAPADRPLVAVIGEIYLRYNPHTSAHLVEHIEAAGGEAWVEPLAGWFEYLAWLDSTRAERDGRSWWGRAAIAVRRGYMAWRGHHLAGDAGGWLADRPEPTVHEVLERGARAFPLAFEGEPVTTVGAAFWASEHGARLIVNAAPFGCMSGRLTQDVFRKIGPQLAAPVVTLFLDGDGDPAPTLATHLALLTAGAVP